MSTHVVGAEPAAQQDTPTLLLETKLYLPRAPRALVPRPRLSERLNRGGAAAPQAEAIRILSSLSYGDDGYFFVYDTRGKNLAHPRQPELVGTDMWNWRDSTGSLTIQRLIGLAQGGGGFLRYDWLFCLVAGICALRRGRLFESGRGVGHGRDYAQGGGPAPSGAQHPAGVLGAAQLAAGVDGWEATLEAAQQYFELLPGASDVQRQPMASGGNRRRLFGKGWAL